MMPDYCTKGMLNSELIYFMQVSCKSDSVNLFGSEVKVSKDVIAFFVVVDDLIGSTLMILLFIFLKNMQNVTSQEIDDSEITARDFGIEIRGLPPHENVREFKAALWQFVEGINTAAPDMNNPLTGMPAENQNTLMNITFALSDYGKMNFMMTMADLFHEKKKLEKSTKLHPDQKASNDKEINNINMRGQKILRDLERYVRINRSKAVVAFAQFQSMTGREKFYKNAKLKWW